MRVAEVQSIHAPWEHPLASRAAVKAQRGSGPARCRDCRDYRGFFLAVEPPLGLLAHHLHSSSQPLPDSAGSTE